MSIFVKIKKCMRLFLTFSLFLLNIIFSQAQLIEKVKKLTPNTVWTQISSVQLKFPTYHPQGMVKVGDYYFMSSVEVIQKPINGGTGEGKGHLFKFDGNGNLITKITLGEGSIYHPGGIDFDGKFIWIPVAEYRPNSQSIIYKVDAQTLQITEVLRAKDHIGAIVYDAENKKIHGASWGSRNFYEWELKSSNKHLQANIIHENIRVKNPSFYIDYQDCHYLGQHQMLCSGFQKYAQPNGSIVRLGGFEIINLVDKRPIFQVPIKLWSPTGLAITNNPFWVEQNSEGIKAYFVPDDDEASILFIYVAKIE